MNGANFKKLKESREEFMNEESERVVLLERCLKSFYIFTILFLTITLSVGFSIDNFFIKRLLAVYFLTVIIFNMVISFRIINVIKVNFAESHDEVSRCKLQVLNRMIKEVKEIKRAFLSYTFMVVLVLLPLYYFIN